MNPLTPASLRASFVNASRREVADLSLPSGFDDLDWDRLDVLGWRDAKFDRRAYAVIPLDGEPVGVLLTQSTTTPRARAQCSWCEDVQLPNEVVLYSAKEAGPGGRNGNTLATLACREFQCSANVRRPPRLAYVGFDVEAARQHRIEALRPNVASFATSVLRRA